MDKRYSRQEIGKRITERLKAQPNGNSNRASMLARIRTLAAGRNKTNPKKTF